MVVRWDGIAFDLPVHMKDESVLTFVDSADAPTLSVTVSKEPLAGGKPALLKYVDAQLAEIKKAVQGYAVTSQAERAVGAALSATAPAIHVQATVNALGTRRAQQQLYVLAGERVVVVTITVDAGVADSVAAATALVNQIAASFDHD